MKFQKENSFRNTNNNAGEATVNLQEPVRSETVYIDMDRLRPNSKNEYKMSEIEKLSSMIKLAGGIWQNIIVKPADSHGYYTITTGERRWRAAQLLRDKGEYPEKLGNTVPCTIKNPDEIDLPIDDDAKEDFSILVTNQYRTKTDSELFMEMRKWKNIISKLRKAGVKYLPSGYDDEGEPVQIQGNPTRTLIADQLGVSTGQVSRMEQVDKYANEELLDLFLKDELNLSATEKVSKLSSDDQETVVEHIKHNPETSVDDAIRKTTQKERIKVKSSDLESQVQSILSLFTDGEKELTLIEYQKYEKAMRQLRKIFSR